MDADRPIQSAQADKLHRGPFAAAIAAELAAMPQGQGRVIALVGPWGAGKTSVLELIKERLAEGSNSPIIIEVNPWLFSGTEQLVELFIREMADQLTGGAAKGAARAADSLTQYSKALDDLSWVPVVSRISGGMKALAFLLGLRTRLYTGSLAARRKAIGDSLRETDTRLLVIVDDMDRLTNDEIRDVVRTVRLVGDFENVTYLLAFDRMRVESALEMGAEAGSGRDYLEKIVQAIHPLPEIRYDDLSSILSERIVASVGEIPTGPFDQYEWQNIGSLAVRPLFSTVRDVYRFSNVLPAALRSIGDEVALHDVLALEAVRVLEPEVWEALIRAAPALGYTREGGLSTTQAELERLRPLVNAVISASPAQEPAIRQLIERVFPAAQRFFSNTSYGSDWLARWRRERRVAHPDVFAIYLHRTLAPGAVPGALMDAVFNALESPEALSPLFEGMSEAQLEECLTRLEAWEEDFPDPDPGTIGVLLRLMPRLREGRTGIFDFGADLALERLVLRLLRRSSDSAKRLAIVEATLADGVPFASGISLLRLVGHDKNAGQELIAKEDSARLEEALARSIASSGPEALRNERRLDRVLNWAERKGGPDVLPRIAGALADYQVLAKLIRDSMTEGGSQALGDAAQRRVTTLPWEWLQDLLPEGELEKRVNGLRPKLAGELDARGNEALALAERYASGWRPPERD
jgi:predicted KAP-like P-loop ATPase